MPDPDLRPAPGHDDRVLYAVHDGIGRVRLNRPGVVNALDRACVDSMLDQLNAWARDDAVAVVFLDGAGDKGLCAGGDVRALRDDILIGDTQAVLGFWDTEYTLNAAIAGYPKPFVAWMDGVVMGGGVGISTHGSVRLVTERSRVAMPETVIGFFPDVGMLWHLSRAPGELGTHLALTGLPVSGADAIALGMADAQVPSAAKEEVLGLLADAVGPSAGSALPSRELVQLMQDRFSTPPPSALESQRDWIDACYAGDDAAAILARLAAFPDPAAYAAGETISSRSPHSVVTTLQALRRAASLTLEEVLDQDRALGRVFVDHPDFVEGVRALLVDKDNAPRWADASVSAVDHDQVAGAFATTTRRT